MTYLVVPKDLSLTELISNGRSLSPSHYRRVHLPNRNYKLLKQLISAPVRGKDQEARNFLNDSPYYYLKTKALKDNQYLIETNENGCLEYLHPEAFRQSSSGPRKLKPGDILYCSSGGEEIGEAAMVTELGPQIIYSSHSFKIRVLDAKLKLYILSFLKSSFCKEQLSSIVYKGATLRRGGDKFLDLKIPFPTSNESEVINYLSLLAQAAINKEREITRKHNLILSRIEMELKANQKACDFNYGLPSVHDLRAAKRIDTNLFRLHFKKNEFMIKNYGEGFSPIDQLDFTISRGQNLQLSAIGESIYTDRNYPNFYTLMLPKHLSRYGTVEKVEYLGNKNRLKTVKKGDVIFGAEGFEKGRSIVITDDSSRTVTNIHGITLHHKKGDLLLSTFVKCFLDFLRSVGLIDLYAVGGNGGSLAMKYWNMIPFPLFPVAKQKEVADLYHNPLARLPREISLDSFIAEDEIYNKLAGVVELDKSSKKIKARINEVISLIVNDNPVDFDLSFLS